MFRSSPKKVLRYLHTLFFHGQFCFILWQRQFLLHRKNGVKFVRSKLQVGVAASYVLWMLSDSFTLFVIARIIGGVSKGNVSLSTAIVTDVSTPEKRGKGMVSIIKKIYKNS